MYSGEDLDPDMAVCANLRESDVFLHVTNRGTFGHLVNADDFDTSHTHNELWEMIRNRCADKNNIGEQGGKPTKWTVALAFSFFDI